MKFMTWTLHKPSDTIFSRYAKLKDGEPWYSDKWEIIDPTAPQKWDYRKRNFLEMIQLHTDKFYSIGLHEFGVRADGRITDMTDGLNLNSFVLNSSKDEIIKPVAKSLRYLMHTYPTEIKWCLQYLCTQERVPSVLLYKENQDTFLDECYRITKIYKDKGFPIRGVEVDFEYTWYGSGKTEADKFRDLLARIKNEVCLPLGVELRVNLFAMTGKYEPSWYAWHDYETVASARDKNGNQAVDEFQMMSYDFSWSGSAPGPSTPQWWLENILKHVNNVFPPEKTFVGNAGYGRRWPLGEFDSTGAVRWGSTLDYKQLMMLQNGTYIHNSGEDNPDGNFYFNDQDFVPFSGFNDETSDYIITLPHVYDKFAMSLNGGATFSNMNMGTDGNYVTKYSREQLPIFSGINSIITNATELVGSVNGVGTYTIPKGIVGLAEGLEFNGYSITTPDVIPPEPEEGEEVGEVEEIINRIKYSFNASGSYRLIALLNFPFYDKNNITINLNGNEIVANISSEWYPSVQKRHFYDLGTQSFSGTNTIEIGLTGGVQIYGFVLCSGFDPNYRGGSILLPTNILPFKKRGNLLPNGKSEIIEAQFPKRLKVVGETIRRPPRPAIIWEDVFGSYQPSKQDDFNGEYLEDVTTGFPYYSKYDDEGYSTGIWKVYTNPLDEDYPHVYTTEGQLILNKSFSTNIVADIELRGEEGSGCAYGIKVATSGYNNGYIFSLDFGAKQIQIIKESNGSKSIIHSIGMGTAFQNLNGSRLKIKLLIMNGKVTLAVSDIVYIKEYSLSISTLAIGVYVSKGGVKLYKYNISSLERWETMEKCQVNIDGNSFIFGSVDRKCSKDEYGYLIYTGYPYEFKGDFPNNNITLTQTNPDYSWENDYVNLKLCDYNSWRGEKTVEVVSLDAGIWYKTIYIGDNEGMSVAYNSDRVGFIKTVNLINDYNCKGIAMWTLGQEDPSIFSYLP